MTLRFRFVQIAVAICLMTSVGVPAFARDDDPRDFRRRDHRYGSDGNDNRNNRYDRDRDDRDDDIPVCHRDDRDDDNDERRIRRGNKTSRVPRLAVAAHQRHGDTVGPCPTSPRK